MIAPRSAHARPAVDSSPSDVRLTGARRTLSIACVLAALAVVVHSAVVTSVALPAIAVAFDVTPAASVRVITAYQMGLLMALLPCAALGERIGHRVVFTGGVFLFTCASALCALAPTLPWLLAARFVQGLGGAAVMALGVALLRFTVARRKLAAAIGWNALTVALSSAAAPTTGALISANASLPWLFASHVPLGVVVLIATRALPAIDGTGAKLDVLSMVLNAAAFAALICAVELMPSTPVNSALLLAASSLLLTVLVRRELPKRSPLVPFDLLRVHSFRISIFASVCCFSGQSLALIALPFHLQHTLEQDIVTSGWMIAPWPLSVAAIAPVAGRLAERVATAWLCAIGGMSLALGLSVAALCPPRAGALALLPCLALCGAGFGLFQVSNNRNMLLAAPRARSGAAGASQASARLFAQTVGAVIMSLLLAWTPAAIAPRAGFAIAATLTLGASGLSMLRAPSKARTPATSSAVTSGGCP